MRTSWTPNLPTGWQGARLRHVAQIYAGGTPDRSNADFWENGGIPWLNSGAVNQDIIREPSQLITRLAATSGATRWVNSKSVVLALAGQGRTKGMAARTEIATTLNQSLAAIRPGPQLDYRFLHYWLKANYLNIRGLAGGDLRDGLNLEHVGSIELPLPPVFTQKAVADYLDKETAEIDALISGLSDLAAIVAERWAASRETAIGASGGEMIQLRRINPVRTSGTSVNGSQSPASPDQVGVLKTGAVSRGYFDTRENKAVTDAVEVERLTTPVVGNRVLVNRANTPSLVGTAVYVAKDAPRLYLSDKLWSIDFDASNEFIAEAMATRIYREQVSLLSVGASASMHNLSYEDFLSIQLPVPHLDRQLRIAEELRAEGQAVRHTQVAIDQAIALAQEHRAALVTAAVTGQIDVTGRRRGPSEAERLEDENPSDVLVHSTSA